MCRYITLCVILFLSGNAIAQVNSQQENLKSIPNFKESRKGQGYFFWGYNRANYGTSDIHLKGDGYDFTLHDVRAHDLPEEWDAKVYLNPTKLTIPQFNFRVGYFITDKISISGGWDHMKYRINEYQRVRITGEISEERSIDYAGTYTGQFVELDPRQFVTIEHTDGFNFVRLGVSLREVLYSSKNMKHHVAFYGGVNAGAMMPWTDFTLFGERNRNFVDLAGYGVSVSTGLRFEFFNYGFVQYSTQLGWSHMMDIVLEGNTEARGEQKITFIERSIVAGAYIPIGKKHLTSKQGS